MMTDPTLGQRILDAAEAYAIARAGIADYDRVEASHDRLRALAARADAAERGMVAVVELSECRTDDGDLLRQVREEYDNALAAWRAITGEVA